MGGRLDSGLGQALLSRRLGVAGRELVGEFRQLGFQEQIDTVVNDLQSSFWDVNARVIANSFGAYPPNLHPGKVDRESRCDSNQSIQQGDASALHTKEVFLCVNLK